MKDKASLSALRSGSTEALGEIIERYTAYVSTVIRNVGGERLTLSDIEELTADCFVALWQNSDKLREDKLRGWLGRVARNAALNRLRSLGAELPLDESIDLPSHESVEDEAERREERRRLYAAIFAMPWPEREIFLRRYYYCETEQSIARQLSMNISTVKTKLRRGRERLIAQLSENEQKAGGGNGT